MAILSSEPRRVQLRRENGRTFIPAGAVRVDRGSRWRPPFWVDHPYIRYQMDTRRLKPSRPNAYFALCIAYREWLGGKMIAGLAWDVIREAFFSGTQLPAPPAPDYIMRALRGKTLADWPELGVPCIGDELLRVANTPFGAAPYPTPSDGFRPSRRLMTAREQLCHDRAVAYTNSKFSW